VTWVNARYGGDRVLIASQAGLNFFLGNNEEANGWSATAPSLMSVDWWAGYDDAVRIAEEESGRALKPSEVSRYWFARSFRWWLAHPLDGLGLTFRKIVYFLSGTEFSNNRNLQLFLREFAPALSYSVWLYLAVMPLAVLGAVSLWKSGRGDARLTVGYVAVYAISIILFFVTARYRVPLRPLLAIFAMEGVRRLVIGWRASPGRAVALGAGVVVFAVAVNANGWVASHRPSPAQFYHSVAIVLSERGDDAAALPWQERAVGYDDTYPKVNLNLGRLLMIAGRTEEAAAAFARERVLDPDDAQNVASLGQALLRLGRPEEAVPAFEDAERLGMEDAPSLYNHAIALERLGRATEAEALYARAVESDSTFADAWNNLGVLLARSDRLEEALDVWERGLRVNPGASRIMNNVRRARERLEPEREGDPE
jgi:Flp pilus assembly protein TadD